jgi:hypothetical protein
MTYLQLDGWYWQENDGWLTEGYYCDWFGVSCSFLWRWRVTAIKLPSNALNGTFPSLLHHMPSLRELDLSRNLAMQGTIPSELSKLNALKVLDLSNANMTGTIPEEIERFEILDRFILSNNSFSGTIPLNIAKLTRIRSLYLDSNAFNGTLHSELGNLTSLVELSLSRNSLSGMLSTELGRLTNLEEINLSNNNFAGPFPQFLGNLEYLGFVFAHATQLTGYISESFCAKNKILPTAITLDCEEPTAVVRNCSCCDEITFCSETLPPGF